MDQQFFIRTTQTIPLEKLHLDKLQKYNRRKVIIDLVQVHHRSHRSYKIVNELIPLIKEQPLFYPFANNYRVINQVCQKIQYRTFHKGQTIYKLKERGDYFYLLLQGTVHLTVPQVIRTVILKLVVELLEQKSNSSPSQRQLLSAFLDIHDMHPPANTQETITQSQATQNNPVEQVQKIIQIVEQGQSFGQMMQDSNLRLTNAVAAEDCHVLYLDKKSYEILLKAQLKSQNQSKYNFLEQLPIFKESAPFAISRISVMMKQQKYVYGQTLFRCGDIIKNIYIVKHGSFKLLRKINRHFRLTTISKIQYKIDTENKKNAEYLIINEGEVLGDIQTIEMKNNYQESCICQSQDATVLTIDKKQLFKILLEDEDNFAKVKEIIATKNVWKNKIVNSFVEKRNRNSLMNSFLSNQKRTITEVSKQSRESSFREEIQNETFFYNQFNRTIDSTPSKCRFSISKPKSRTDNEPTNLFVPRNKKKQGVPHGIEDIVSLVKLKTQFQKRFRRDRKQKCLFKFNKDEVPLYIKTRFSKFQ